MSASRLSISDRCSASHEWTAGIDAVLSGDKRWTVVHGSSLEVLRSMPDESVDSLVTDPPAGIAFMGRDWDKDKGGRDAWIAWLAEILTECVRVLKPGAHCAIWALPRTAHWTGMAIDIAGLEVRDCVNHIFGSGFPKSLNVSKAIDEATGAEREVATDAAKQWNGWGTALKPAHEYWWIARKPLRATVAANVQEYGTGAINIDACRVAHASAADLDAHAAGVAAIKERGGSMEGSWKNSSDLSGANDVSTAGRWPANVCLTHSADCRLTGTRSVKANPTWATPKRECESSFTGEVVSEVRHTGDVVREYECAPDCPVLAMDGQSGECGGAPGIRRNSGTPSVARGEHAAHIASGFSDAGSASRFFTQSQWQPDLDDVAPFIYCAKPSRSERDRGLDDFEQASGAEATGSKDGQARLNSPRTGAGRTGGARNIHPTVKPVEFIRWLCRLITPPKGVVLDLFCGSGSHGCAAVLEGFSFIGVELNNTETEPFVDIARARITHVVGGTYTRPVPAESSKELPSGPRQISLFGNF